MIVGSRHLFQHTESGCTGTRSFLELRAQWKNVLQADKRSNPSLSNRGGGATPEEREKVWGTAG
ncbi:MAG: hypothetical protein ABGZ19_01165 [Verrucomicrobiales bacterium]